MTKRNRQEESRSRLEQARYREEALPGDDAYMHRYQYPTKEAGAGQEHVDDTEGNREDDELKSGQFSEPGDPFYRSPAYYSGTSTLTMSYEQRGVAPWGPAAVVLLQGPMYTEDRFWPLLGDYEMEIRKYFLQIGLELHFDREEGYAYLRQMEPEEGDEGQLPRMIRRIPLSYEMTLLLVLLREWLDEYELSDDRSSELHITGMGLKERLGLFLEGHQKQSRFYRNIEKHVRQARELGYLSLEHGGTHFDEARFTVKRILKAKIAADELEEIKARLLTYLPRDASQPDPSTG